VVGVNTFGDWCWKLKLGGCTTSVNTDITIHLSGNITKYGVRNIVMSITMFNDDTNEQFYNIPRLFTWPSTINEDISVRIPPGVSTIRIEVVNGLQDRECSSGSGSVDGTINVNFEFPQFEVC
jgi:hypothetical protein